MTVTLEQNIAKAKNLVSLWQKLKEEQSRKTTHAYKTETSESWLAVQAIDNKVSQAQTEIFAIEKIILKELGIEQKWL